MSLTKRCLILLEKCRNMIQLKQSHAQVITCGLANNSFALSRLLAFCSDPVHGNANYGFALLQQIQHPTICIYNTMLKAFLLNGKFSNTVELYKDMMRNGMSPDNYTLPYVLKACVGLEDGILGELVHTHCLKLGFMYDTYVGNTLIVMYSAFGDMGLAQDVFDDIPLRTEVAWTVMISGFAKVGDIDAARLIFDQVQCKDKDRGIWGAMISGYVQNNCFKEAIKMFRIMQSEGLFPDEVILVSVLSACAHLGALDIGIWVHRYLERFALPLSVHLGTSLIVMYAKCGRIDLAKELFVRVENRDTICWNAMISGMAMNGDGVGAIELFWEMEKARTRPDDITFIAVLSACCHSGMANQGVRMISRMRSVNKIDHKIEHYSCIVDILCQAGLHKEAKQMIGTIPNSTCPSEEAVAWRAFLNACCKDGQTELAEVAAQKLQTLERHSGVYVLLSNLYAAEGKHDDAKRMRTMMRKRDIDKAPGCSSVEINGVVHEFIAGEKTHPSMEELHELLSGVNKHSESSG